MGDQFLSMNGSPGFDFGTQISALDWYKNQQSAKLISGGLKNLTLQPQYHPAVDNFGNNLLSRVPVPTPLTKETIKKGTDKLGKIFEGNTAIGGFINSKASKFGGQYGGVIGDAASAIGDMIGKRGLDGKYGGITKGVDTAYDTIQKAASNFGPVGNIVSGAMGVGKLIGNAVSKIGGGTDGMTKTDAILNSAFLNLTPLGLINGFGGKKANTYTRNTELDKSTNGGFQGFLTTQDVTQIGAGKKYGLFSSGARNKQNQLTEFTQNMKHTVSGIVDTNTINNLTAQGSTPFLAQRQQIDLSGGIQQMRAARQGMRFSRRVVSKYAIGNKLKRSIQTIDVATGKYVDIPLDLDKDQIKGRKPIRLANGTAVFLNGDGTVTSDRWETLGTLEHLTPKGQGGMKLSPQETGEEPVEYLDDGTPLYKKGDGSVGLLTEENIGKENLFDLIEQSNANFAKRLRDPNRKAIKLPNGKWGNFKLSWSEDEYGVMVYPEIQEIDGKLVDLSDDPEKAWQSAVDHKDFIYFPSKEAAEWFTTHYKEYYRGFDEQPEELQEFKQGGQMNVIPEGALHARLNHLDQINDDLTHVTTKGIPVITKEGGEVVQHAEIEHSEIIFTLDVTNKIEDLRKKWHEDKEDKYAIEAGKLLVKEILHNTDDRTNLIESVE